jgi:hypothetical protein
MKIGIRRDDRRPATRRLKRPPATTAPVSIISSITVPLTPDGRPGRPKIGIGSTLPPMPRLARRAGLLFASYAGLLLAVLVAGFLGTAIGIWASILWGAGVIGVLALYTRRRLRQPRESQPRPSA